MYLQCEKGQSFNFNIDQTRRNKKNKKTEKKTIYNYVLMFYDNLKICKLLGKYNFYKFIYCSFFSF
jgi:hypothetical protein